MSPARNPADERTVGSRYRCANCPKFFVAKKKNQRFHSTECKAEFHRHGSSFGKLQDLVTKLVKRLMHDPHWIRTILQPVIAEVDRPKPAKPSKPN